MPVDKNKFNKNVNLVIDNLEGGYYHPQMLNDGRVKDSRYKKSGETMFGIDRARGGDINTSTAGKKFWNIIDNANASSTWKWNYKGGNLAVELKTLVSDMMFPLYTSLSSRYLDLKAKDIIDTDDRLLFHFIYGTWNGPGWFKKFAEIINKAVKNGITDTNKLTQIAIDSRTSEGYERGSKPNSLIAQGAKKIAELFGTLKTVVKTELSETLKTDEKANPVNSTLITTIFFIGVGYFLYKSLKK